MTTSHETDQLARTISILNNKGGVGKTSTVANVAGYLAQSYRVLAIDLNHSGNLGLNFGYRGSEDDDAGLTIVEAIQDESPLGEPIRNVRPNLDVYGGGRRLKRLTAIQMSGELSQGVAQSFAEKLATRAEEYDFVLIDCPPDNITLQEMALTSSRYVLIPITADPASWDGITEVGPSVNRARRDNPDLTYLGAFLFGHPVGATRLLKNTHLKLDEIGDRIPLLNSQIRYSLAAGVDCRTRGQLIHELAGDVNESKKAVFAALRSGTGTGERLAGTASQVAADYQRLAEEILARVDAHETTTPISQAGS